MNWLRLLIVCVCCTLAFSRTGFAQKQPTPLETFEALERQIIYHPRAYPAAAPAAFIKRGGKQLNYQTTQGKQAAFLIAPMKAPRKLWVMCGGNASVALDFEKLARALPKEDAYLLVEYPGYGLCEGKPSPAGIRENLKASIGLAVKELKLDDQKLPEQVNVFGYSLGCAAALVAVEEFHLKRAVLCAPFTSTAEMATTWGMPAGLPLQHVFDNRVGLAELKKNQGKAWIFHGDKDEVIPVTMGQTLGQEFPETTELKVIAGATHRTIFTHAQKEVMAAMGEASK